MAHDNIDGIYSLPAAADLTASQFHFGVIDGTGKIAQCGAGAMADGRIDNAPASGEQCRLIGRTGVVLKIKAGAAVALGAYVHSDSTGRAITSATAGHQRLGKALRAASAAGEMIEVYRKDYGANP